MTDRIVDATRVRAQTNIELALDELRHDIAELQQDLAEAPSPDDRDDLRSAAQRVVDIIARTTELNLLSPSGRFGPHVLTTLSDALIVQAGLLGPPDNEPWSEAEGPVVEPSTSGTAWRRARATLRNALHELADALPTASRTDPSLDERRQVVFGSVLVRWLRDVAHGSAEQPSPEASQEFDDACDAIRSLIDRVGDTDADGPLVMELTPDEIRGLDVLRARWEPPDNRRGEYAHIGP